MIIKHVDESNVGTGIVDVNGNVGTGCTSFSRI